MAILKKIAAVFVGIFLTCQALAETPPTEYQVKVAFLYHFSQFATWPPSSFEDPSSPLRICVLQPDPFGRDLDRMLHGKQSQGRPVETIRVQKSDSFSSCHLLFIGSLTGKEVNEILKRLPEKGVLTVGERNGFADQGGIIQFVLSGNKVRFIINSKAAQRSGLKISSKLLSLAEARL